jgi:hypothetical protein
MIRNPHFFDIPVFLLATSAFQTILCVRELIRSSYREADVMLRFGFLLILSAVLSACGGNDVDRAGDSSTKKETTAQTATGTVRFVNVEGGCWKIEGDDGESYEPVSGPDEIGFEWVDGQRVEFTYQPAEDIATICMVGKPIHLEMISALAEI